MSIRRNQELIIGIIGVLFLLVGIVLVTINWMPASAEVVGFSNAPLATVTAAPSPTPTFTPTPIPTVMLAHPTEIVNGKPPVPETAADHADAAAAEIIAAQSDTSSASSAQSGDASAGQLIAVEPVQPTEAVVVPEATPEPTSEPTAVPAPQSEVSIDIDVSQVIGNISPGIYGLSAPDSYMIEALRPTGTSWGGNNSSRYNWAAGNYWNSARDYQFNNGTYGTEGQVADQFLQEAMDYGINTRLTIPTLGWVAKDWWSCSFPDEDGNCKPIDHYTNCDNPILPTDPTRTSIPSTPNDIRAWMQHIKDQNLDVTYVAMDNEPELWGFSHYDVHPDCSTYQELLDSYIKYASVVNEVIPEADLVGPVTCCWHFYWQSAAGLADKAKHDYQDWLPWFLSQMQQYEKDYGLRLLDVLDIHYYPEGLYEVNPEDETEETMAHRIRSTRSLWDPTYVDESWVNEPVMLLPRMKAMLDEYYPGTRFGISEWNFGADDTMGGAIALADALGQFGIHEVEYAYYWRHPNWDTPGYNAFRMFTNYDWAGGRYGDLAVSAESSDSSIASYSAIDRGTGNLHVMLINKNRSEDRSVTLNLANYRARIIASQYRYDETTPGGIDGQLIEVDSERIDTTLPPYSITQLILSPAGQP